MLGLRNPRKVSQALRPALRKIALLFRADATRTIAAILDEIERLDARSGRDRP